MSTTDTGGPGTADAPAPTVVALPTARAALDIARRFVAEHDDLAAEFVEEAQLLIADLLMIATRTHEPFLTLYLRTDPPEVGVHVHDAVNRDGGPGHPLWFALRGSDPDCPGPDDPAGV